VAGARRCGGEMMELPVVAAASEPEIAPRLRLRPDRRDLGRREALFQRVAGEFREVPGLCVTAKQGCRMFGLPQEVCERIFNALIDADALQRAGSYYGLWRNEFVGRGFISPIVSSRNYR
jgi:hypothetical protein